MAQLSLSLNIVSFDIPYPANYGGVIDVFYKIRCLHQAGIKIYLHCFFSSRNPSKELESLCEKVYYYPRATGFLSNLSLTPYTVKSRRNSELAANLLLNDAPVLFEVLHTCELMADQRFAGRKKIYRHSNIEHDYYNALSRSEKHPVRRLFLKIEAWRLKRFEKVIAHANLILAVNSADTEYFRKKYPQVRTEYLPSFHEQDTVEIKEGNSDFVLFHGNLSVPENSDSAEWLISHVFSKIDTKVIIAGLKPPAFLKSLISRHSNIELVSDPDHLKMKALISEAHIHVLHTAQPTGLKLKLLNVLFSGRYVVCNTHMIAGTGISPGRSFVIANTPSDYISSIKELMTKSFSADLIEQRKGSIHQFENNANVRKLLNLIAEL